MKLVEMSIRNYRQFEKADIIFEDGITVLAGANNSGKTSLITLIKNVFYDEKSNYCESDIPVKNMQEWITEVYPIFVDFFINDNSIDKLEEELVEKILPKDEKKPRKCIDTTRVRVHVSYDPLIDDIKLFADYIMDLDEKKNDFFFEYCFEIKRLRFIKAISNEYEKIKKRFDEIHKAKKKLDDLSEAKEKEQHNIEIKERYLKQKIVRLYVDSIVPTCYFCDESYENKCQMDDVKQFRNLFSFWFIKAGRPLDDDVSDHSHSISKQMIKLAQLNVDWNELIDSLPDEILKPIQDKEISKKVQATSMNLLKETILAIEKTNGGQSGEMMLDMHITEEDISNLLQRIIKAKYCVDGYFLGEESQGLGYSNLIYILLQLNEYKNDKYKVNVVFVEEPESHMHPQMQQVFIKYLIEQYKEGIQGLITTHSNEMVRVAGITRLRVIRKTGSFVSKLYDLSKLIKGLKDSDDADERLLADFYDWFFEIGYSELIFADKAIFYEGDTERLYIRKLLTLEKYETLKQQYIAYIQVGGAYAKNYKKMIELLGIKSLIITDLDYDKSAETVKDIGESKITNATIKEFYRLDKPGSDPTVNDLYAWVQAEKNVISKGLIYTCYQTSDDGYARTLEEAMLSKYFDIDVTMSFTQEEWIHKRDNSKLKFVIPSKGIKADDPIKLREILESTSGAKTSFMYSVVLNKKAEEMEPKYIQGGLKWLMELE